MRRALGIGIVAAVALGAGAFGGYRYAMQRMMGAPATEAAVAPAGERKPLYYHDPMFPQRKFDMPGKSLFMDMQLVPVYGDEKPGADSGVTVSARARQNLGMRTAVAELTELRREVPAVGNVQADERRMVRVETRTAGWVEKLFARGVNEPVRAGQVLAEVYSPDLFAAQEEYLLARRMAQAHAADESLAGAARRRLESVGLAASESL